MKEFVLGYEIFWAKMTRLLLEYTVLFIGIYRNLVNTTSTRYIAHLQILVYAVLSVK